MATICLSKLTLAHVEEDPALLSPPAAACRLILASSIAARCPKGTIRNTEEEIDL